MSLSTESEAKGKSGGNENREESITVVAYVVRTRMYRIRLKSTPFRALTLGKARVPTFSRSTRIKDLLLEML